MNNKHASISPSFPLKIHNTNNDDKKEKVRKEKKHKEPLDHDIPTLIMFSNFHNL